MRVIYNPQGYGECLLFSYSTDLGCLVSLVLGSTSLSLWSAPFVPANNITLSFNLCLNCSLPHTQGDTSPGSLGFFVLGSTSHNCFEKAIMYLISLPSLDLKLQFHSLSLQSQAWYLVHRSVVLGICRVHDEQIYLV